jgi:hypothetical protein
MDADRREIEAILASFTLTGDNLEVHTRGGATAWAPIVQASTDTLTLPIYGLDVNPFLFLLTDLRSRHEADWFRVANNREGRWIEEIQMLFNEPRWHTHGRNLRLRESGKDVTDIDFAAFDRQANELALFQLKWQHPVGMDNRGRRSTGRNLIEESNRWVDKGDFLARATRRRRPYAAPRIRKFGLSLGSPLRAWPLSRPPDRIRRP